MDQREYWDSAAEKKEFTTPFQAEAFAEYVGKDAFIADIGCGYGRTLNELRELLQDFDQKEYEHLVFTTMNGNKSNGFYFIGEKP